MTEMETTVKAYDLLHDAAAREDERKWISRLLSKEWIDTASNRHLQPGISVIIPAHRSRDTLGETIRSLAAQSMPPDNFEVLIVCNGHDDGTEAVAYAARSNYPSIRVRIYHSDIASAGSARNIGLSLARHEYVTFVDADDQVEPRFLETAYKHAAHDRVVASPIIDYSGRTFDQDNALNLRIRAAAGTTVPLAQVPWLLGFNACKLVATEHLMRLDYDPALQSGEDLVFFAQLLAIPNMQAVFPTSQEDAGYIRKVRPGSVSRRDDTFQFNVQERVDCITALRNIELEAESIKARRSLENSQLGFVKRHLEKYPDESDELEQYLAKIGFIEFPWDFVNKGKAKDLAISYCFSPYSDTSAVVAEKAIAERRKHVDIISNRMEPVRHTDASLSFLSARWVDRRILIDTPPSFAGWEAISQFAEEALLAAEKLGKEKGGYDTIYSRALWVGSHVAAALFKLRHPEVRWSAEFSDPLRFGVEGKPREGDITPNRTTTRLVGALSDFGHNDLQIETLFDLVEAVTLILADEVIFTNENQRQYMLSGYPSRLASQVEEKSTVRPHPIPSAASYSVVPTAYRLDAARLHIGYFGSFYANRGLNDVFTALLNLSKEDRNCIALHIFCNSTEEARIEVEKWGLQDVVRVNAYLPYMEFLNATTYFDVLLVSDIERGPELSTNPFLPSKLSDYRGSGARIWGVIDAGSPLSEQSLDFASPVGDSAKALKSLRQMISTLHGRAESKRVTK